MEKCNEKSHIVDESYQRIRNLVCQEEEPYRGILNINSNKNDYNKYLIFIMFFLLIICLRSFFYLPERSQNFV